MKVVPVSVRGEAAAVRDALLSHGWEGDIASLTASGLAVGAFHVAGVDSVVIEAMVPLASRLGLELVTGDDWLLLLGPRSQLGAFARPWLQPEPVQQLAMAIGMAMPADQPTTWSHSRGEVSLASPVIVGIINATPDSFSEASRVGDADAALERVDILLAGGATIIDIGGESTRPGSEPISAATELARVIPVVEAIARRYPDIPLSVDTINATTALAAIDAGASIINDVTAGHHDPAILQAAAESGAGLILSHSRGAPGELTDSTAAALGSDPVTVVVTELAAARDAATSAGVRHASVVLDPGFGFGKTAAQNWRLLASLDALVALGSPVMVGVSRKRFLGDATGRPVDDRDRATAACCAIAFDRGARIFRVHEPAAARDALEVARAVNE